MHDALFAVQQWTPAAITETATRIGLDMTRFQADLNSQETRMQLAKDRADAQAAEVNATPSIFVNGRPARERSLPALQAMVNEALAAGGAK
jgi:protein-disulfide isomerase